MKKIIRYLGVAALLMVSLWTTSCVSKKMIASKDLDMSELPEMDYLRTVVDKVTGFDEFSAKMRLGFSYGEENISVGGSIKMKKDEVIQLSLVAVGIVEAARIEISPKRLLVLDRIGRRYVEVKYDDFSLFKESKIDFYTLQALFWNELFLPGVKHVEGNDIHRFQLTRNQNQALLTTEKGKRLSYSFLTTLATGLLEESRIHVETKKEKDYQMNWTYRNFLNLENKPFPVAMQLSLQGVEKPIEAMFQFSRCSTEVEYEPLSVPNRYREVDVADILKHLLSM